MIEIKSKWLFIKGMFVHNILDRQFLQQFRKLQLQITCLFMAPMADNENVTEDETFPATLNTKIKELFPL